MRFSGEELSRECAILINKRLIITLNCVNCEKVFFFGITISDYI